MSDKHASLERVEEHLQRRVSTQELILFGFTVRCTGHKLDAAFISSERARTLGLSLLGDTVFYTNPTWGAFLRCISDNAYWHGSQHHLTTKHETDNTTANEPGSSKP